MSYSPVARNGLYPYRHCTLTVRGIRFNIAVLRPVHGYKNSFNRIGRDTHAEHLISTMPVVGTVPPYRLGGTWQSQTGCVWPLRDARAEWMRKLSCMVRSRGLGSRIALMQVLMDSLQGAAQATGVVAVIDVFRAFTSAAVALANRASRMIMVRSLEEALELFPLPLPVIRKTSSLAVGE